MTGGAQPGPPPKNPDPSGAAHATRAPSPTTGLPDGSASGSERLGQCRHAFGEPCRERRCVERNLCRPRAERRNPFARRWRTSFLRKRDPHAAPCLQPDGIAARIYTTSGASHSSGAAFYRLELGRRAVCPAKPIYRADALVRAGSLSRRRGGADGLGWHPASRRLVRSLRRPTERARIHRAIGLAGDRCILLPQQLRMIPRRS